MAKPFARDPDGHTKTNLDLWMEEGAGMVVLGKILDKLFILLTHFRRLLSKAYASRIYNCKI
jgi:hypothetical protein